MFSVNSIDKIPSDLRGRKPDKYLPRNNTLCYLHVIDSLHRDKKVEASMQLCCLNVQSLRNKRMIYNIVSQSISILALTETWFRTANYQLTINKLQRVMSLDIFYVKVAHPMALQIWI